MSTYPDGNATIVDLTYKQARIQAFLREAEGQLGFAEAAELFPELAPYIHDEDGVAHLNIAAARAYVQNAQQARTSQLTNEGLLSSVLHGIRCAFQIGLFVVPLTIGVGVAIGLITKTDSWGSRIVSCLIGWSITSLGYGAIIVAYKLARSSQKHTRAEHTRRYPIL